jgi:hypothetical protein
MKRRFWSPLRETRQASRSGALQPFTAGARSAQTGRTRYIIDKTCSSPKTAAHFLGTCSFVVGDAYSFPKQLHTFWEHALSSLVEHVLLQKPLRTFWEHALSSLVEHVLLQKPLRTFWEHALSSLAMHILFQSSCTPFGKEYASGSRPQPGEAFTPGLGHFPQIAQTISSQALIHRTGMSDRREIAPDQIPAATNRGESYQLFLRQGRLSSGSRPSIDHFASSRRCAARARAHRLEA